MNVPALVQSSLGDEDVAAHVPLKGENAVFVTPTRTLVYTEEGLLSDEAVEEFDHGAERIEVSDGRRKATVTLDYGLDGEASFSVPSSKLADVLHPVIAGVLNDAGVTQPGETVKRTYRFSELTLVVTSDRVVKHVGSAVWGPEYEEIAYDSVTGIDVEEGNVSSQLVLETTTRPQRIKAPNEQFRDVRETVEEAVYAYHDAADAAEFERMNVADEEDEPTADVSFGGGVEPIDTSGVGEDDAATETGTGADADASTGTEASVNASTGADSGGTDAGAATNASADTNTGTSANATAGDADTDASTGTETNVSAGTEANASTSANGAEPSTGEPASRTGDGSATGDEFASSGFQAAAAESEPAVDPGELDAAVDELADTLDDLAAALDRQREVIDAQRAALEEQRERIAELRELADEE